MKVEPSKSYFQNLKDTTSDLQIKLNKYKSNKTENNYNELIESHKDYRTAWVLLKSYVSGLTHNLYENEHILIHTQIYKEHHTSELVQKSTIDDINRGLNATICFLDKAKGTNCC
jgi:hypothetical protein